jgi:hypothetical protein
MKRLFPLLATLVLAACASPVAQQETPQQALHNAATATSKLHSAKFDLAGVISVQLPPQLTQGLNQEGANSLAPGLGQALASGSITADLSGSGQAQFPDKLHATINTRLGGLSVKTEEIVVGGKAYTKNPVTGQWSSGTANGALGTGLSQPDPLSYAQLLDTAGSIKDLGDTTLNGDTVHHYQVVPDKAKLAAKLDSVPALKDPQARQAFQQILDKGTLTTQVWIGKSDHLLRRLLADAKLVIDLSQFMSGLGAGRGTQGLPAIPAGSTVTVTAHLTTNYHDFNSPVSIQAPA